MSEAVEVDIPFGEYANPSFESQVETVAKGKQVGIMSLEAPIEELYGDSRDEQWKAEEVARLKSEQGIVEVEEPGTNMQLGGFEAETEEEPAMTNLNGAQIASLLKIVESYKTGQLSRTAGISIVTSTLGVSRENAEIFIEEQIERPETRSAYKSHYE